MRDIEDILKFRPDISPFLVHLTRPATAPPALHMRPATDVLTTILQERRLVAGRTLISDARFGMNTDNLAEDVRRRLFSAICFTETPLGEVHNLLDIAYRGVNLSPYGLVFLKERLEPRGVSPVLYFNNCAGDKHLVFQALCGLHTTSPNQAVELLPLVAVFGQKIWPPGAQAQPVGEVDFRWEREWRRPSAKGPLPFDLDDIFIGLCPDAQIAQFEQALPGIGFIDPTRNMKWYATKLVQARQRCDIKVSVV